MRLFCAICKVEVVSCPKLNDKQKFADEYIKCLNASEAYRKAGYKSDNIERLKITLLNYLQTLAFGIIFQKNNKNYRKKPKLLKSGLLID